ncbi:MAG TPA: hypothetical protein VFX59_17830, partial [Polyangiales bacterium]|nr:hypothetical protein [Polyangiales bacterium]
MFLRSRVHGLVLVGLLGLTACDDDDSYQPDQPTDGGRGDAARPDAGDAGSSSSIDASSSLDASLDASSDGATPDASLHVSTARELVRESDADFAKNNAGLITGS